MAGGGRGQTGDQRPHRRRRVSRPPEELPGRPHRAWGSRTPAGRPAARRRWGVGGETGEGGAGEQQAVGYRRGNPGRRYKCGGFMQMPSVEIRSYLMGSDQRTPRACASGKERSPLRLAQIQGRDAPLSRGRCWDAGTLGRWDGRGFWGLGLQTGPQGGSGLLLARQPGPDGLGLTVALVRAVCGGGGGGGDQRVSRVNRRGTREPCGVLRDSRQKAV